MKILILGNNGGAHFLAQKLLEYPEVELVTHLFPNKDVPRNERYNPVLMTKDIVQNKKIILDSVQKGNADLIIATATHFQLWQVLQDRIKDSGIPAFMPAKQIGLLEWSKIAGKKFLKEAGVPTPDHRVVSMDELIETFEAIPRPFVLKYDQDWRAGRQTIVVTDENYEEEYLILKTEGSKRSSYYIMGRWESPTFAVEEYVEGVREYSYHALCNKTGWKYAGTARDYKRRYDGDKGFNTAGMGAYSPVEINPKVHTYVDQILKCLKLKGIDYVGALYLGIMEDKNGDPVVLEINTRPGDPEWQTILPTIDNNLPELFMSVASNEPIPDIKFNNKCAVSVRVVHEDYDQFAPDVRDLPNLNVGNDEVMLSHNSNRNLFFTVATASGNTVEEARNKVYEFLDSVDMKEFTYRRDIGLKL